jgi:uncharacterized protein (DUF2236 family)
VTGAADFGIFGPGSMAWRLHGHPALLAGGLRALIVQALHPLAIAAVAEHSDYRSDVWGRFNRTSSYIVNTIYGSTAMAWEEGRRVRAVHRRIRGTDPVTGLAYSADDPELLLWIHCTLVDSFLAAYRRYVGRLSPADADAYVAEMVRQAELVGLGPEQVPSSEGANAAFIDGQRPILQLTTPARQALETVVHPPLPAHRRPYWWTASNAALVLLPDWAAEIYGLPRRPLLAAGLRPFVAGASWIMRLRGNPPPALAQARVIARAAGHPI